MLDGVLEIRIYRSSGAELVEQLLADLDFVRPAPPHDGGARHPDGEPVLQRARGVFRGHEGPRRIAIDHEVRKLHQQRAYATILREIQRMRARPELC